MCSIVLLAMLTTILLCTCGKSNRSIAILEHAENIMDEHPDSALLLLNSISSEQNEMDKSQYMTYHLLLTDARYRTGNTIVEDSIIIESANYYDLHGTCKEQVRANYLAALVYDYKGNTPMALQYYMKAVAHTDTTDTHCDWHLLGTLHAQMAKAYGRAMVYSMQMNCIHKAEHAFFKANDTVNALKAKTQTADIYAQNGDTYRAITLLDSVADVMAKQQYHELAVGFFLKEMPLIAKKTDRKFAESVMQKVQQEMHYLASNHRLWNNYYACQGILAELQDNIDSAGFYYMQANLSDINDMPLTACINGGLMRYYTAKGNLREATRYATYYTLACDSLQKMHAENIDCEMYRLYTQDRMGEVEKHMEARLKTMIAALLIVIFVLCIAGLISHQWYKRHKQWQRIKIERHNMYFQQLRATYDHARHEYDTLQNDFLAYKQAKGEELESLRAQVATYLDQNVSIETWDKERELFDDKAISHLHSLLERGKIPSGRDLREVVQLAEAHLPDFWAVVCNPTKHLSLTEIQVCVLLRVCFIPSEIAAAMNISMQRVSNAKASIHEKLFGTKGAKGLEDKLLALH